MSTRGRTVADQNPLDLHWLVPGACPGTDVGDRAVVVSYVRRIAEAADRLGFKRALIPPGSRSGDLWIVATWGRPTPRPRSLASRSARSIRRPSSAVAEVKPGARSPIES
jgi:alkanesulfonate monooxygenase SsuD/methylene tetrahydromethanopterin reductase-like flavin-dependent oxidoreductase (luciferase family)